MNIYTVLTCISAFAFGWSILAFTKSWKEGGVIFGLYLLTAIFDKMR